MRKTQLPQESTFRLGHVDVEGVLDFYRDFSTRVNGKLVREPSRIIDKFIVRLLSLDRHDNAVIVRDQVYNRSNYTHCLTVTLRARISSQGDQFLATFPPSFLR